MPRASDLPTFHTAFIATPAPSNPLGVKGGSESGTIGAPAAIGNAVIDALWHLGVRDIALADHVGDACGGRWQPLKPHFAREHSYVNQADLGPERCSAFSKVLDFRWIVFR